MSFKINIDSDVVDNAKFVACKVDDTYTRKRVYALGIAANAVAKYLNEKDLKTHSNHSLYKSAVFAKEIEIADIYANNARFDVRVTFNDKTFTVPKLQVKYDIKPQAYIVVRFDNSLNDIEFLGFIPENELKYDKNGEEYYTYPLDILKPFEEFIPYAQKLNITPKEYSEEEHEKIQELCASIIDEQATEADKIFFIKHVVDCAVCRDIFCDINDFDDIVSQLKNYHELLNDSTLSVLSGNKKEVDQAAIANMALVEKAGEDFPQEVTNNSSILQDTISAAAAVAAGTEIAAEEAIASTTAGIIEEAASQITDEELEPAVLNLYDEPEPLTEEQDDAVQNTLPDQILETAEIVEDSILETTQSQETEPEETSSEAETLLAENDEESLLLQEENTDPIELELSEDNNTPADEDNQETNKTSAEETQEPELQLNDSFDELNASIDAFASEPAANPFELELEAENDEQKDITDTDTLPEVTPEEISEPQLTGETKEEDNVINEEEALTLDEENIMLEEETETSDNLSGNELSLDFDEPDVLTEDIQVEEENKEDDEALQQPETAEQEESINLQIDDELDLQLHHEDELELPDDDSLNLPEDIETPEEFSEPEEIQETESFAIEPQNEEETEQEVVQEQAPTEDISDEDELTLAQDNELPELNDSDSNSLELEDLETLDTIEPIEEEPELQNNGDDTIQNIPTEEVGDRLTFASEDDKKDEWPAASRPQEPVELKYDDETETQEEQEQIQQDSQLGDINETVFDLNKQEPVIESFEEEDEEQHVTDFDFPDYNYSNIEVEPTAISNTEQPKEIQQQEIEKEQELNTPETQEKEETEQQESPTEDNDLQGLLDDDLLALLSDEDNEPAETSAAPSVQINDEQPYTDEEPQNVQTDTQVEETQFTTDNNSDDITDSAHNEENGEIENLFEEQEAPEAGEHVELDLSQEPMSAEAVKKTKKIAIAGALIALLAIGGVAGGYYMYQKNIAAANNDSVDTTQDNQVFDFQNNAAATDEAADTSSAAVSQDINKSMTNSFSDKPAAISITKLSWQVNEKLAVEPSVKEYLQTAGKNIQLNLQNDLANAADVAFNNSVKVSFEIAPDNTMKGIQVLESSGSDKIDAIITKSIKNTLKYVSVPKLQNYNSDYFLTLIINF